MIHRQAFAFLFYALALAGCTDDSAGRYGPRYGAGGPGTPGSEASGAMTFGYGSRIALLAPLTGARADLGQVLVQAAQLALQAGASPQLDVLDTTSTPSGAVNAMNAAIRNGDGLVIGPLTSAETASVAPIARSAGIPVMAFTNDASQAQPGVWTLGITPEQQIRRLVVAAQAQGKGRFAALLPDTDYGRAMSAALYSAVQASGLPEPIVKTHAAGMAAITASIRDLSDYANRRGPIDKKIRTLRAAGTPEARREAQEVPKTPIPPPPFDVLLLADTGDQIQEIAAVLPYYDVDRGLVQIIGPALWADPASGSGAVQGAWYAAPDNNMRGNFSRDYQARYGAAAPAIADLAFDAASIARVVAGSRGADTALLTQPSGFVGTDGWITLTPDGRVKRGLAVFRIERGGASMVDPAMDPATAPGL